MSPDRYQGCTSGQWMQRTISLNALAGSPIAFINIDGDQNSAGAWTADYADIAITSTDGSVLQLFDGQPLSLPIAGGNGGMSNVQQSYTTSAEPGLPGALHFYVDDPLGTAQMEFAAGGYPVWAGQFAPYGSELDAQTSTNHYKFTGKERDAESGLDYFGARYLSSNMGRWMSPDNSDGPITLPYADLGNPQSLNLYAYVNNNPLSMADPDGHDGASPTASCSGFLCWLGHVFSSIGSGIAKAASSVGNYFGSVFALQTTQQQSATQLRTFYGGLTYNGTDLGGLSDGALIQFDKDHRDEFARMRWAVSSVSSAAAIGGSMFGANGTQMTSKTLWQNGSTERIDVENPNPG